MKIKKTSEDIAIDIFVYVFVTLLAFCTLFPFMNIVSKALSENWAVVSGKVGLLPTGFNLDSLKLVVSSNQFLRALGNSALVTFVGTAIGVFIMGMTAYPLSKRRMPGMRFILLIFVFTMYFGGGMIPTYLLIKNLHMINKLSSIIVPGLINVFHMLIIKNFYDSLPESLEESAKLDGANNLHIFIKIIMPLSLPVYASIVVFSAVMRWNDYFSPMLYINSANLKTLPLYLRDLISEARDVINASDKIGDVSPESVTSAAIIASTVPILCVYPFLQKYFIKGMLIGSVKG